MHFFINKLHTKIVYTEFLELCNGYAANGMIAGNHFLAPVGCD